MENKLNVYISRDGGSVYHEVRESSFYYRKRVGLSRETSNTNRPGEGERSIGGSGSDGDWE